MFCAQQPRLKSGLRFAPEWRNPSNPTSLGGLPAALPASVIADPKATRGPFRTLSSQRIRRLAVSIL